MKLKSDPEKLKALVESRKAKMEKRAEAEQKAKEREAARKAKEQKKRREEKKAMNKLDEDIRIQSIGELDPVIRDIFHTGEPKTLAEGKDVFHKIMNTFFAQLIIEEETEHDSPITKNEEPQREEKAEQPEEKIEEPAKEIIREETPKPTAEQKPKSSGISFPKKQVQAKAPTKDDSSSGDYFDVSKKPKAMANPMLSTNADNDFDPFA